MFKRTVLRTFIITVFAVLFLAAPQAFAGDASSQNIPAKGMPTLLDLGGDCLPCELQDRIVKRVQPDYKGRVAFVWVEVEKNLENRKKWKVEIVPTLVFFNKEGKEVERASGYVKESKMRALLDRLCAE